MPGVNGSGMAGDALGLTTTPTAFALTATRAAGIVTVITMTPTTTAVLATATPVPSVTMQPTSTLPLDMAVPTFAPDLTDPGLSPGMAKIVTDIQDLYRIMQATQVMMQTYQHGQLTEAELVAMKAQLTVVDQRMEKLAAALQAVQSGTETFGPDARILPEHTRQLIELMRQALGMVQTVLSGPNTDNATLAQAQTLIEQLHGMMGQIQSLVISTSDGNQPTSVPATLTPAIIPSPAATLTPTATPIPATSANSELNRLQAMLSQMVEILRQMQSMLEQMQNQP
jgi:hypothetical protein